MSIRNLTNQASEQASASLDGSRYHADERDRSHDQSQDQSREHLTNPFADDAEDDSYPSHSASDTSLIHHGLESGADAGASRGGAAAAGISDYKGYYSKAGASAGRATAAKGKMPAALPSSTSLSSYLGISNNDILSPPAFDRYPLVGSRVASMAAINNKNHASLGANPNNSSSNNDGSSSSITSSNPFLSDQDFSPFGGYPTSSFPLHMEEKEDDDYLHNPDPEEEARLDKERFVLDFKHMDKRSAGGLFGILFLFLGAIALFVILPIVTFTGAGHHYTPQVVALLTLYEYPQLSAIRTDLVDPDTPSSALSKKAKDGSYWKLVFSDEFNAVGRSFYDGDDQFWTAADLNYAATKDLEWYTPDAATTADGTLQLRMDAFKNNGLSYRSGMLQSWNKLCFTQGNIEISAQLPNYGRVTGLWPGLWTMGNLGRPGYMASTEGVWPYSYEACDAGITPNQSSPDGISYLPGQKLSSCTCDGEDHPNQGVGRGAPEIDIIEAEADTTLQVGLASQSLQIAPFDIWYIPDYDFVEIYNFSTTAMNGYCGGPFQQAVSAVSTLNITWYEFGPTAGYYQKYGFEYLNDREDGYVQWFVGDDPTFTIYAKALHPNGNIDWRLISQEPMSIIMNLGISNSWAYIDWASIYFPVTMSIDYVRIYQPNDSVSITCDPTDYPTYDYIQSHLNAYSNVNLTSWEGAGYTFPSNNLTKSCKVSKSS